MRVLWNECMDRLSDLKDRDVWSVDAGKSPFVLVWHIGTSDSDELSRAAREFLEREAFCRGILFIRGQPHSAQLADSVHRAFKGRVHCLSYAVREGLGSNHRSILRLFKAWIDQVSVLSDSEEVRVPWEAVEPTRWPQHVVALYLGLLAADRVGGEEQCSRILGALPWAEAQTEYEAIPGVSIPGDRWSKTSDRAEVLSCVRAGLGR